MPPPTPKSPAAKPPRSPITTSTSQKGMEAVRTLGATTNPFIRKTLPGSYHAFPSRCETAKASSSSSATFWAIRSRAWASR